VVARIDPSINLQDIVHELRFKAVTRYGDRAAGNSGNAAGTAFLDMFEANLRLERQRKRIKAAKACAIYEGRKSNIDRAGLRAGCGRRSNSGPQTARRPVIGCASVYRVLVKQARPAYRSGPGALPRVTLRFITAIFAPGFVA